MDMENLPPFLRFYKGHVDSDRDALNLYLSSMKKLRHVSGFDQTRKHFYSTNDAYGYAFEIIFGRYLFENQIGFRMNVPTGTGSYDFEILNDLSCEVTCDSSLYETNRCRERINRQVKKLGVKARVEFCATSDRLVGNYSDAKMLEKLLLSKFEEVRQSSDPVEVVFKGNTVEIMYEKDAPPYISWTQKPADVPTEATAFSVLWDSLKSEVGQLPDDKPGLVVQNAINGQYGYRYYIDQPSRIPCDFRHKWPDYLVGIALWECDYDKYDPMVVWLMHRRPLNKALETVFGSLGARCRLVPL